MARATLIEFRRGTAAQWTAANPTLAAGEPGFETDTGKLKIGDGATAWNALAYFAAGSSGVTSLDAITGAVTLVAGSGVVVTDNSPAAGDITIAASGTASGAEISYAQITTTVAVTSTNHAAPTTVISSGAVAFNGSPVILEFYCPAVITPSASPPSTEVGLYESGSQLARLGVTASFTNQLECSLYSRYRFTPSAGTHTYTIGAYSNSTTGTPQIAAGGAGGFVFVPTFLRFSYA